MKFDFGEVLSRMWKIGWNHKVLWLWQMLPGSFSIVLIPLIFLANPFFGASLPEPLNQLANESWVSVALVALAFVVSIPIMFLGVIAQLTTVYGAVQVEKGAEHLTFGGLFRESMPYFWRVLGLYAIFFGVWMLIYFGFMAFLTAISFITFGLGMLCFFPFFLLLIPLSLVGYSVLELAQAAIVADGMNTVDAISHAWKLFRSNWLGIVLLMLVLYVGMYIISMMISFPMYIPMMMFGGGMNPLGDVGASFSILFLIFFVVVFMLAIVMQGILMAFFQSAWAVAYLRMNQNVNTPIILNKTSAEAGA